MNKHFIILVFTILATIMSVSTHALKSDRNQPATLDADEFDLDFQTGIRTYRGNVVYQQGSIRLYADEVIAHFKEGDLSLVTARGNPAKFTQRPDDAKTDVVGVGLKITMNNDEQIVTLQNSAKVTQDANTITGKLIVYDMATEKVKVRGARKNKPVPKQPSEDNDEDTQDEETTSRPRLVIQPRKN